MTPDIALLYFLNGLAGASPVLDALIVFLAAYLQYALVAAFLALVCGAAYPRRQKLSILWTTALSIAIARGGVAELIRALYHRPRPFLVLPVNKLLPDRWFYSDAEGSFPSGHSVFFFAMAAAIYVHNKRWGALFFAGAIAMNISRVIAGVHYPSDILGGALTGVAVGYAVVRAIVPRRR